MLNALPCKLGVADLVETDGGAQLLPDGGYYALAEKDPKSTCPIPILLFVTFLRIHRLVP
jgi:hypothetical protein